MNIVAMLREVNRGSGASFGNMEKNLRALLDADPKPSIRLDIEPRFVGASEGPPVIPVQYEVNGGDWMYGRFENR